MTHVVFSLNLPVLLSVICAFGCKFCRRQVNVKEVLFFKAQLASWIKLGRDILFRYDFIVIEIFKGLKRTLILTS